MRTQVEVHHIGDKNPQIQLLSDHSSIIISNDIRQLGKVKVAKNSIIRTRISRHGTNKIVTKIINRFT